MRLRPAVLILAYLLSVSLPASGTWTAGPVAQDLEPDTWWDVETPVMFGEPPWPNPQYHLDLALDAWTTGGATAGLVSVPGASPWPVVFVSAHARLGKWLDCTRDGVFGDAALLGADTYPELSEWPVDPCDGVWPGGHWDGTRLHEFAAVGPGAFPRHDCEALGCTAGDRGDIHDARSIVWLDLGSPDLIPQRRALVPFPRGTLDTFGAQFDYLDDVTHGSISTAPVAGVLWPIAREAVGERPNPVTHVARDRYNDSRSDDAPGSSAVGPCWRAWRDDPPSAEAIADASIHPTALAIYRGTMDNCRMMVPAVPANLESDEAGRALAPKVSPDAVMHFIPATTFSPVDHDLTVRLRVCVPEPVLIERCGGHWSADRQWTFVPGVTGWVTEPKLRITATAYADLFRDPHAPWNPNDLRTNHFSVEASDLFPGGSDAFTYGAHACLSGTQHEPGWACDPDEWMVAQGASLDDPYRHAVAVNDLYDLRDTDCRTWHMASADVLTGYACED